MSLLSLYDELQYQDELIEQAQLSARWRREGMLEALTIREVDNTHAYRLAVEEKLFSELFHWEAG